MKITKAVIPAAGLGTRVLPATKSMPKEMLPIVDKPAIQYIVEEAVRSGITDILIITNRGKGLIEDHFDRVPELAAKLTSGGAQKEEILREVNKLGIGPSGCGGTVTALDAHIVTKPTHIAGMPVAVNICCHALRHAHGRIEGRG